MLNKLRTLFFSREAGAVKRNHNWQSQQEQLIGQHSWGALNIYLIFHPHPEMDTVMTLQFHDCGERIAGDLPAPAKWHNPDLNNEYISVEHLALSRNGMQVGLLSPEEALWVKACDKLEFMIFAKEELLRGNQYAKPPYDASWKGLMNMMEHGDLPLPLHEAVFAVQNYMPKGDMEWMEED